MDGNEKINYKHEAKSFPEAIGETEEYVEAVMDRYNKIVAEHGYPDSMSGFFQGIYDNFSKKDGLIVTVLMYDMVLKRLSMAATLFGGDDS